MSYPKHTEICTMCCGIMGYLLVDCMWKCPDCGHIITQLQADLRDSIKVKQMQAAQAAKAAQFATYYGKVSTGHSFTQTPFTRPSMTPQPSNIRIWWDASVSAYRMTSPYNKDLVEALKSFIPVSDRSYDPMTKVWTFVEKVLPNLQMLFTHLQLQATIITKAQTDQFAQQQQSTSAAPARNRPLDTVIIEFVKLLPYDAAKKAYRAAAMELHPDKQSGDSSKMTTLNSDWDRIAKEVYGQ